MNESKKWWWIGIGFFALVCLYLLSPMLTPFIVAALLAYLFNPLVNFLQRFKLPRTLAAIVVFMVVVTLILALLVLFIPLLEEQIVIMFDNVPKISLWLQQRILPLLQRHFGFVGSFDLSQVKMTLSQHWRSAGGFITVAVKTVTHSTGALISLLFNLLLIPVVTFYLLRDWNKVVHNLHHLLPRTVEKTVVKLVTDCNEVLGAFFRGQLLVMVSLGVIYSTGLSIAGLDVALLIGLISGLVSIVPYLGFIVGIGAAIVAAALQFGDVMHIVYVVIAYLVGQAAESMLLTPLLVGDRIGLHPVAVIFSVLAGGNLFGFFGVLLALPVAAVIMIILRYLKQRYMASDLYQQQETL